MFDASVSRCPFGLFLRILDEMTRVFLPFETKLCDAIPEGGFKFSSDRPTLGDFGVLALLDGFPSFVLSTDEDVAPDFLHGDSASCWS